MGKKDQKPPRLVMGPLFEHVEDAWAAQDHLKLEDIDPETVLDDNHLVAGGLRPLRAWVRTKKSNNALRQQKKRETAEADGKKQISITTRKEHHDLLREIALLSKENEDQAFFSALQVWLDKQTGHETKRSEPNSASRILSAGVSEEESRILEAYRSGGMRAKIIRWMAK
jgi:hypothetical protein